MSKQSSGHPNTNQITKGKSTKKIDKPYVLWAKQNWLFRKDPIWSKIGSYKTKETAENVIEKQKLTYYGKITLEYKIITSGRKPK